MLALNSALGGVHDLLARALVLVVFTAGGLAALATLLSRGSRGAGLAGPTGPLVGAAFAGLIGALIALQVGGAGALLWLVLACLAGAAIQGAEARLLAGLYRPRGASPIGQAISLGQALAATFAALLAGAALHAQQTAEAVGLVTSIAPGAVGLGLAVLLAGLLLRGPGRWLAPLALLGLAVHVGLMLMLVFGDPAGLSRVLAAMPGEAFGGAAAAGGMLGAAAQGVLRASMAGATGGLGQAAALGRGAWGAPLVTAAVALVTGLAAAVSGATLAEPVAGRELLGLERPLRAGLTPSEFGQLVVLPADAGLEEGQRYPVVLRADPRGHRYGEVFREENLVAAPGWGFTAGVDTVILRDRDPVRAANPGFDLRIPVTRELLDTRVGPFLKLRPVDPSINIRQLMTARGLAGPFLNIDDHRFEAGVLRGYQLAGGERLSLVPEPPAKDAPPTPPLRDLITLNYSGPYADHGEAAPPRALAAPVEGGLVAGSVVHLRLDAPARGLELGFVNRLGELETPPWDFLAAAETAVLRHREDPALDRRIRVHNRLAFGRLRFWSDEIDLDKLDKLLPEHSGPHLEPPSYSFAVEVHRGARLPAEHAATSLALIPLHPQSAPTGNPGPGLYRPHPGEVLLTGMTGPFRDQDAAGALLDALARRSGRPLAGLGALALGVLALAGLLLWQRAGRHPAMMLLGPAAGPGFTALFVLFVALGPALGLAPLLRVAEVAAAIAVLLGAARLLLWLPWLRRGGER